MPSFGQKSKDKLATAHKDLQKVFNEVIKEMDCTIIYGHRTVDEQFELFKQGRELRDGKWVKVGKTVTNLDGLSKKSMHNYSPSLAIDVAPYPINWNDLEGFKKLSEVVLRKAKELGIELTWGGSWSSFPDYPHYELKKS